VPPELEAPHAVIDPSAVPVIILVGLLVHQIILTGLPLSPLKPMAQSRRGVIRIREAQVHLLIMAIPRRLCLHNPNDPTP
jgi:hypothetical protein